MGGVGVGGHVLDGRGRGGWRSHYTPTYLTDYLMNVTLEIWKWRRYYIKYVHTYGISYSWPKSRSVLSYYLNTAFQRERGAFISEVYVCMYMYVCLYVHVCMLVQWIPYSKVNVYPQHVGASEVSTRSFKNRKYRKKFPDLAGVIYSPTHIFYGPSIATDPHIL